jgi:hypothetical protein
MDRGACTDDLVNDMVTENQDPDAKGGFILTVTWSQGKQGVGENPKTSEKKLNHVLHIELEDDTIINRLRRRSARGGVLHRDKSHRRQKKSMPVTQSWFRGTMTSLKSSGVDSKSTERRLGHSSIFTRKKA